MKLSFGGRRKEVWRQLLAKDAKTVERGWSPVPPESQAWFATEWISRLAETMFVG